MRTWGSKIVLNATSAAPGNGSALKTVWNTSVYKGPNGSYIMAIETQLHGSFTINFATSTNLMDWEVLDVEKYTYGRGFYTGDPCVRYLDGWYAQPNYM